MVPTHRAAPPARRWLAVLALALLLPLQALAYNQNRVATDESGKPVRIAGSVVVVEPDIELSLVTAGGLQEPRRAWTRDARRHYAAAVRAHLGGAGTAQAPDVDLPDDLDPDSRLGQVVRLNEAVALSISQFLLPHGALATKRDGAGKPRLDWTLGDGVAELRTLSGADFALFTYVRDSYTSEGRAALRVLALLAGAAVGQVVDIGGGQQVGVSTLVDLRTGQVVQFAAALAVTLPAAWWLEPMRIVWNADVVFAMAWSVFVLTAGGISLMFYMLRHGRVTAVSSTMYLVPSVTSVMAWLLFGETLGAQAIAGMGVTLLGVYLVVARKPETA